jgi:hypothetical protein
MPSFKEYNTEKICLYKEEVTYKGFIQKCYIELRVEERLKSECRYIMYLIEHMFDPRGCWLRYCDYRNQK